MSDPIKVSKQWQFDAGLVGYYTVPEVDALIASIPTPTTTSASVDLTKYAKIEDKEQWLLAKTVTAQGFGFGDTVLPNSALTYTDTGEGYGQRLVLAVGEQIEHLVYKSDLDPLNALFPRIESLEGKESPAIDLAPYALKADLLGFATEASVAATYVTKADARIYTTAADVAAHTQANYAPKDASYLKAETYNKTETDDLLKKYLTTVTFTTWGANYYTKAQSEATFASQANTYTKTEVDAKIPDLTPFVKVGGWLGAVPQSGSTGSVASRKIGDDMIQLHGNISFGTAVAANTWSDVALLQSNARPAKDTNFVAVAMDGTGTPSLVSVWVYATGKVTVRNYASITSVQFNHIMASR